jgi:hypothetical protein
MGLPPFGKQTDSTANRDQIAENAEGLQRSRGLFLCDLRAASETSAVREVSAVDSRMAEWGPIV